MDDLTARILDRLQEDIGLVPEPYAALSRELGIDEEVLMERVGRLRRDGVIRDISAIVDARRVGYGSALIAFRASPSRADGIAERVNEHPGVSHNYLRDHDYRVWFTLAVSPGTDLDRSAGLIARRCEVEDYLVLRNERLLKIGVHFSPGKGPARHVSREEPEVPKTERRPLSDEEIGALRLLQTDLPLDRRPFARIIESGNGEMGEERLLELGGLLRERGAIRRYAAVLRHRSVGFVENAMTAWRPDGGGDEQLRPFLEEWRVSHLYIRTVYPGRWEYPLFAMLHARDTEELGETIERLSRESGIGDRLVLRSLREYKKRRVRYFSEELLEYERRLMEE